MAAPNLDEKSARVRNLLSSYYGTETPAESPASSRSATSSTAFKQPRSLGLDSTAFDVDRHSFYSVKSLRSTQSTIPSNAVVIALVRSDSFWVTH